jgi:hypothetical protein
MTNHSDNARSLSEMLADVEARGAAIPLPSGEEIDARIVAARSANPTGPRCRSLPLQARKMSIVARIITRLTRRPPDFIIGDPSSPYLRRWHVIPRNRFLNIYLHQFLRSDDDRALHDHPWMNASILLRGRYTEVTPSGSHLRRQGHVYLRRAKSLHRVELIDAEPVWTLFITGPRLREWGFACPNGWRHWRDFCATDESGRNSGTTGRGCE